MMYLLTILFLVVDFSLDAGSFFDRFFSAKKEAIHTNQINRFSSIDYKSILNFLKKYQPHYHDVSQEVQTLNQMLYCLSYIDHGAVQVFHKQNRLYDFQEIQYESCIIKNKLYTDWFLNKNSFFLDCASKISSLKNAYVTIQNAKELFKEITFAQKNITPDLEKSIQQIITTSELEKETELKTAQDTSTETINDQQEKIKEKETLIAKQNELIISLQNQIKAIEDDTQDWQDDLEQLNNQIKAYAEYPEQFKKLEEKVDNERKNINKQIAEYREQIEQEENTIKSFENRPTNAKKINSIIERIDNYNVKKQQELDEQKNKGFLERVQNILKPEPEELVTVRTAIVNTIATLDIYEKLSLIQMFDKENFFTKDFIEQLRFFSNEQILESNKEILESEIQSSKEAIKELESKLKALKQQEKDAENNFNREQAILNQKLAEYDQPFKHNNILQGGSTESTTIINAIEINKLKIENLEKQIEKIQKDIAQTRADIASHKQVINATKLQATKNKEENSKSFNEKRTLALKNLDITSFAQNYVAQLMDEKHLTNKKNLLFSLISTIQLLRFDLRRILAIPVYQPEISINSLQGPYQETPTTKEIVSYKAAQLKQEASEKLASAAIALAKKKEQLFGDKKKSITKEASKTTSNTTIYCKADLDITDTIQAKLVGIMSDINEMITHTLTLAQTTTGNYYELVALKDLLFIPLCSEYEQIKKIATPWGITDAYLKEQSQNFTIEQVKKEYTHLITFQQSLKNPKEFLVTDEPTNIVAFNFFTAIAQNLTEKVNQFKSQKDESDKNWLQKQYHSLYQLQRVLHICTSTQLRWYHPSKNIIDQFNQAKNLIIEKKASIVNQFLPTQARLKETTIPNTSDFFIKNNKIDGKLIQTIKQIHTLKESLFIGSLFFSTPYKKQSATQTIGTPLLIMQARLRNIITYPEEQKANTENNLYQQIVQPLYDEIATYAEQLLRNIPHN